jgi:hypothetical protein
VSRQSEGKKSRRKKRKAVRDQGWVPAHVAEQLQIAADLEGFDSRLTDRGWEYSEDDEAGVFWVWRDSVADVDHEAERADATVVLLTPDDGGEVAHVILVGTSDDYQFGLDELFEHIDAIEAYRLGDPIPLFV